MASGFILLSYILVFNGFFPKFIIQNSTLIGLAQLYVCLFLFAIFQDYSHF